MEKEVTLALTVVAKNAGELESFVQSHTMVLHAVDELLLVSNPGKRFGGLAKIGNRALGATRSTVFGLIHADTAYGPGALDVFKNQVMKGVVSGIVGRPMDGRYVWARHTRGEHVSCLDGCSIFFRRSFGLSFDEKTFDDFHCVVEDVALSARSRGIPLLIPKADADHKGSTLGKTEWVKNYHRYVQKLHTKYPKLDFVVC